LLKAGEPAGFGITVELLMLASLTAIVAGLFISTQSSDGGLNPSTRIGTSSGALVLELLAAVPLLCALPALFHELVHSPMLHAQTTGSTDGFLGVSELLPAVAILPFMIYQLAGFGTLHYLVPKWANWAINIGIVFLIAASVAANRQGNFGLEKTFVVVLISSMAIIVLYGVLKLQRMQTAYDANCPPKPPK
jgi:hypothetical protein